MGNAFDSLTDKQKIFVMEYSADMDRGRAAKEAGYKGNLAVVACKLLNTPKVQAAIEEVGQPIIKEAGLTIERIIQQLASYVFYDAIELYQYINPEGYLKNGKTLDDIPRYLRQCIVGIDIDRDRDHETGEVKRERIKIRLVDKLGATRMAGEYLKMFGVASTTNVFGDQNNINIWEQLYNASMQKPPAVVEERMQKALEDHSNGDS